MSEWTELVPTFSINPDAATRHDVAKLAAELMECRHELYRLKDVVHEDDKASIERVLSERQTQDFNPETDPDYERFVMSMAKHCRCRPPLDCPCAGVLAGGLCDDLGDDADDSDYCSEEL